MSYRLIDGNAIAFKYPEVSEMPCVFADLPGGMNGQFIDAQPERKKGKWIGKPIEGYCTVRCSVCKNVFRENNGRWNFCPTCGADNRGETNDAEDIH